MTVKEYLSQAFILDKKITSKKRQLENIRKYSGYASPVIDDMPKAHQDCQSVVERNVIRILELEQSIQEQLEELLKLRSEIAGVIGSINNPEYETLLEMRYLSFMGWSEIAAYFGYSSNYVFEVHRHALGLIRWQK